MLQYIIMEMNEQPFAWPIIKERRDFPKFQGTHIDCFGSTVNYQFQILCITRTMVTKPQRWGEGKERWTGTWVGVGKEQQAWGN